MGMFNYVKSKTRCPVCGGVIEWQSKELAVSGYWLDCYLGTIKLKPHMEGEMHSFCDKCDAILDVRIKNGKEGKVKWTKMKRHTQVD